MFQFLPQLLLDERLRKLRFFTALIMFAIILVIGSIPGARTEIGSLASGLVLHSVAYGGLTLLLFTGMEGQRSERAIKAVLIVMAMGATDEAIQALLPYRVGAVLDWMVDSIAAIVTAALAWRFLPQPVLAQPT